MNKYGLDERSFDFIIDAIGHYADIDEARIFGSRALGNYKSVSDIDIALMGNLKDTTASGLRYFLNNAAPFLYRVDVLDYVRLSNQELKKHIDKYGKIIYRKEVNRIV